VAASAARRWKVQSKADFGRVRRKPWLDDAGLIALHASSDVTREPTRLRWFGAQSAFSLGWPRLVCLVAFRLVGSQHWWSMPRQQDCEPERVDHVGRCQSPGGIECQGLCRRLNAARAVGQEDVSREHHAVFAIESDAAPGMAWNVHDAKARDRVAILEQDVCVDGLALGASAVDCATCLLLTPWPSAGCAGLQRNPQRQACV